MMSLEEKYRIKIEINACTRFVLLSHIHTHSLLYRLYQVPRHPNLLVQCTGADMVPLFKWYLRTYARALSGTCFQKLALIWESKASIKEGKSMVRGEICAKNLEYKAGKTLAFH